MNNNCQILLRKSGLLRAICVLCFAMLLLLSGCGRVQTAYWVSFADSLETGSRVYPKKGFFDLDGTLRVAISKAEDPHWEPDKELSYPYAGILMNIRKSGKEVDLTGAGGIEMAYSLQGAVSLRIVQKDIPAGAEYRIELPQQKSIRVKHFSWKDFSQPEWVEHPAPLDFSKITGLMFTNSSQESSTARLAIKDLDFPGWSDPHDLLGRFQQATN